MRTSLRAAAVSATTVLALSLAACSSGDDESAGSATGAGETTSDTAAAGVTTLGPQEALPLIEAGEHTVIDVRTAAEYAAGHLEGASNLDASAPDFAAQLDTLDRAAPYVVYCQSGNRSAVAAATMAELGFTNVTDAGGITDLAAAGATVIAGWRHRGLASPRTGITEDWHHRGLGPVSARRSQRSARGRRRTLTASGHGLGSVL